MYRKLGTNQEAGLTVGDVTSSRHVSHFLRVDKFFRYGSTQQISVPFLFALSCKQVKPFTPTNVSHILLTRSVNALSPKRKALFRFALWSSISVFLFFQRLKWTVSNASVYVFLCLFYYHGNRIETTETAIETKEMTEKNQRKLTDTLKSLNLTISSAVFSWAAEKPRKMVRDTKQMVTNFMVDVARRSYGRTMNAQEDSASHGSFSM